MRIVRVAFTVEDANGVGLKLDDGLLDGMIERFAIASLHLDRTIVVARGELALYENMRAAEETLGQCGKSVAVADDLVPHCFLLPLVVAVLPGPLGRDAEVHDGGAVLQNLGLGIFSQKSHDGKLIEIHLTNPSFCPLLGHEKSEWRLLPNPEADAFLGGPGEFDRRLE